MTHLDAQAAAAAALPDTYRADPLADGTIARIFGPHEGAADTLYETAGLVNRLIAQWQTNAQTAAWQAPPGTPAHIAAALLDYLRSGTRLPDWADPARIERAEDLFMDMSMLSCTLLFCASLPECYVVPDLAAVLHVAGQLEQHTDYRIRMTAAMIFPVMMKGGLAGPDGGGVAQALKVRLIHATIRYLILRGDPQLALAEGRERVIPALPSGGAGLHHALFAHGWDIGRHGLPCNQEELAYTLLTFHYSFLAGLRRLGLPLPEQDERAYLHAWNVLGHVIGIERQLMADTMDQAKALFERMQARGRAHPWLPDPRPALGQALVQTMEDQIPLHFIKPFPALLTRYLCGKQVARELGIEGRWNLVSLILFVAFMGLVRGIDTLVRLFIPQFSVSRLITRIFGYQFTARILMDQTRPLKLPDQLLNQVGGVMQTWQHDPKAPKWMNTIEDKITGRKPPSPKK